MTENTTHGSKSSRLTNDEIKRYSRQLIIPEFGIDSTYKPLFIHEL